MSQQVVISKAITVATTATQIVGQNHATGRTVVVYNNGSATVYIGGRDVTTTNGLPLVAGASVPIATGSAIYGIVAASTVNVRRLEVYP